MYLNKLDIQILTYMNVKNMTGFQFCATKSTTDPFTITAVLHSSLTYLSEKMIILQKNHDFINTFNSFTTLFYGKGYYYYSQMSHVNAGLQLS